MAFLVISFSALFFDNDYIRVNQHYFFISQLLVLIVYLIVSIRRADDFFIPSLMVLLYYLLSYSLGAYFVPRDYGFSTVYYSYDLSVVSNYPVIAFYLLMGNTLLLRLTCLCAGRPRTIASYQPATQANAYFSALFLIGVFFIAGLLGFAGSFGIQIAAVVCFVLAIRGRDISFRVISYLILMAAGSFLNHDNKREVILLFLVLMYLELYLNNISFKPNLKSSLAMLGVVSFAIMTILVSSVLRGYGGFESNNVMDAIMFVPAYIGTGSFVNSLVDNFEVSHTYPAAILSVEYVINGKLTLIWGESIIKPLFLMIPRELISFKPDSVISIFTKVQDESFFNNGGSLPVPFVSELFVNFHFLGLAALYFIFKILNRIFIKTASYSQDSVMFRFSVLVVILVFIFARGGGFNLYFMTLITGMLFCVVYAITRNGKIKWK